MIHGILDSYDIPWEERLGIGMAQTIGENIENIVFEHERKLDGKLVVTHLKDGKPFHQDIYNTDNSGRLKKWTAQEHEGQPYWTYEYEINKNEVFISRTNPKGEILRYKMVVTKKDAEGRVLSAEYRDMDSNQPSEEILCERDKRGKLVKETISDGNEQASYYFDDRGRYVKFEAFAEGILQLKQVYKH